LRTLFRQATDQQIVGLYDRLRNTHRLVDILHEFVDDAEFRQLIDALRCDAKLDRQPNPPSECYLELVLPLIPQELLYEPPSPAPILEPLLRFSPGALSRRRRHSLFIKTNQMQNADLSNPVVLQAVVRCTGLRFGMFAPDQS
jgi:hypothetical protein